MSCLVGDSRRHIFSWRGSFGMFFFCFFLSLIMKDPLWLFVQNCSHDLFSECCVSDNLDRVKRIWYLSPMRAAKVQASLRIRAVSPEPSLLAHRSSESRGTFRQKARSLAPLNGWACAVKMCHDGMLEETNSLDGAHLIIILPATCMHSVIK